MLNKVQIIIGFLLGLIFYSLFHFNAPVLLALHAKNWSISESQITAEVEGYKIRNCSIIAGSSVGYVINDGVLTQVPIVFEKSGRTSPTSFVYKIAFGKWSWEYDREEIHAASVMVTAKYECGGTIINQMAGPFTIPTELLIK